MINFPIHNYIDNTTKNSFDEQICANVLRSKVDARKKLNREKYDSLVERSLIPLNRAFKFTKEQKENFNLSDAHKYSDIVVARMFEGKSINTNLTK
jgi:hypothetical protein